MSKAKIEHEILDSKIATAAALFNEWIKWCEANGILARKLPLITQLFEVTPDEFKGSKSHDQSTK